MVIDKNLICIAVNWLKKIFSIFKITDKTHDIIEIMVFSENEFIINVKKLNKSKICLNSVSYHYNIDYDKKYGDYNKYKLDIFFLDFIYNLDLESYALEIKENYFIFELGKETFCVYYTKKLKKYKSTLKKENIINFKNMENYFNSLRPKIDIGFNFEITYENDNFCINDTELMKNEEYYILNDKFKNIKMAYNLSKLILLKISELDIIQFKNKFYYYEVLFEDEKYYIK